MNPHGLTGTGSESELRLSVEDRKFLSRAKIWVDQNAKDILKEPLFSFKCESERLHSVEESTELI